MTALVGARIFDGERFLDHHAVVVDGARIAGVAPYGDRPRGGEKSISAAAFSRRASSTFRSTAAAAR